jgi:hypothetical protein
MVLIKSYPFGGKVTRHFGKIAVDRESGIAGFRIGFIPKDGRVLPGDPIIVPFNQISDFCQDLGIDIAGEIKQKKTPIRVAIAKKLIGDYPITEKEKLEKGIDSLI